MQHLYGEMKSSSFFYIILLLALVACSSTHVDKAVKKEPASVVNNQYNYNRIRGSYRGDFDGTDIVLVLRYVSGKHAVGYNVHRGLRRNISGPMDPAPTGFTLRLSELGDNPYDGIFSLTLDTASMQISGKWTPANQSNLTAKSFVLKKDNTDTLAYDGYDYFWSDSIGKIAFNPNAMCIYRYYPRGEKQFVDISGNWKLQNNIYTVDWEPNTIFPSRRSIFRRQKMEGAEGMENYEVELVGEGRVLTPEDIP